MSAYSRQKFVRALLSLLEKHPVKSVAAVAAPEIIKQGWANSLDLISNDLSRELLRQKKHLEISLTSAYDLPHRLRQQIAKFLADQIHADTTHVTVTIDPALLGGFIATTPAGELDASLSSQINQLKHQTNG
ncbi:MAG: F0F1 ATP synthase subunit delta [Candidatus Andersenbacteria bacterium]|nr:F0F1 ATP synthase subunit delta [bacterium]MDZ4225433.1 F0F1 ATP synthase subunit delta [Candidatus Andersenbacteria bacterium]